MKFTGLTTVFSLLLLLQGGVGAQDLDFETLGQANAVVPDRDLDDLDASDLDADRWDDSDLGDSPELPPLTQNQWARIGANGELVGRVSFFAADGLALAGPGMMVKLVRQGRVVGETLTDAEGEFGFVGVRPGLFTIVAADSSRIAVYAVTAVPSKGGPVTELDLIAVSGIDRDRSLAMVAGATSLVGTGSPQIMPVYSDSERQVMNTYKVRMSVSRGFRGMVSVPGIPAGQMDLSTMRLRVVRGDRTVVEKEIGANGEYSVDGIGPGPVGVIFYGPHGFAAMGIEIVAPESQLTFNEQPAEMFVSLQDGAAPGLNVELAPVSDVGPALAPGPPLGDELGPPLDPFAPPPGAGGFGGGPGGGFGGGGGGGGLGGIGGLAAIGAAVAAAVALSDDDDDNFVPAPASPAMP